MTEFSGKADSFVNSSQQSYVKVSCYLIVSVSTADTSGTSTDNFFCMRFFINVALFFWHLSSSMKCNNFPGLFLVFFFQDMIFLSTFNLKKKTKQPNLSVCLGSMFLKNAYFALKLSRC